MVEWAASVIEAIGYWGVAALMFLENIFPPLPSEIIMPLAGFTAARSESITLYGVILAGTAGSVVGQLPLYYLGRWVGRRRLKRWADRYGTWLTVSAEDIERAEGWFERHGGKAVFFCRFVPGIRTLISIPAGTAKMHMPKFLLYSTVGMGIWAAVLAYLGLVLGEHYLAVEKYLNPVAYAVFGIIVLAFIFWVARRKWREKQGKAGQTRGDGGERGGEEGVPLEEE